MLGVLEIDCIDVTGTDVTMGIGGGDVAAVGDVTVVVIIAGGGGGGGAADVVLA